MDADGGDPTELLRAVVRENPEAARRVADLSGGKVRDRLHRILDDVDADEGESDNAQEAV